MHYTKCSPPCSSVLWGEPWRWACLPAAAQTLDVFMDYSAAAWEMRSSGCVWSRGFSVETGLRVILCAMTTSCLSASLWRQDASEQVGVCQCYHPRRTNQWQQHVYRHSNIPLIYCKMTTFQNWNRSYWLDWLDICNAACFPICSAMVWVSGRCFWHEYIKNMSLKWGFQPQVSAFRPLGSRSLHCALQN